MQSKASSPPRRPSFSRDDLENSSLAQVLSQRLTNMEQQLFLLKDDLKNAVGTLKEKDREIQTLQNRIALAERRRELEEAGKPVDESLRDVFEGAGSKPNSKRDVLESEVVTLARKLEEMEKFFGDYGLAWIKEDALDERDPNNLWIRKSNIHYTPDFEKVFLVVEELNLGNAEPQIVRKGNTAQFKTAQLLNLTLYADGIQLESNPFRKYDSPSVEEFFRDLEDGYFPTELKGSHPEGVIFKVKDKRAINFADDADKRPVISPGAKPDVKTSSSPSSPTSLSSLRVASRRSSVSPSPGSPGTSKAHSGNNAEDGLSAASSRKGSSSKRKSSLKKTPSRPSGSAGDVKPTDTYAEPKEKSDPTSDSAADNGGKTVPPSTPVPLSENTAESGKPIDATVTGELANPEPLPDGKPPGDAASLRESGGIRAGEIPGDGSPGRGISGDRSLVVPPGPPQQGKTDLERDFKELFRGKSPSSSAQRLPAHSVEPRMEAQPKDAYGLPRPPFPSSSNTAADVRPLPLGPPSNQFDNFAFPKTTETQTSLTLMPDVMPGAAPTAPPTPCPQPTHVTNITYNEAPITVQMTPSEFTSAKGTTGGGSDAAHPPMQRGISCPTHHPHPCDCVRIPCDPCASQEEPKEGIFGSVGLAKFPAETEYREKFTESAINNRNVLEFKKRSHEAKGPQSDSHSPSPIPVPRQPAATLLVGPDEAPIPPDPVHHGIIDPNVKWEHFTFLGHPKGQEPIVTPEATKRPSPKRKPSPQIIQLNEKTSDRMISVRMRTKSGAKEYNVNVYPEEPVKKLWSLLRVNDKDYSLSSSKTPHVPLKHGSIGEVSKGEDLTIVISKNKGGSETQLKSQGSANSRAASQKKSGDEKASANTRKEVSSVSKDGSHTTNVNISISVDSHSSYGGRSKSDSLRPSTDTKAQPTTLQSRESSQGGGSVKGSSKSLKAKKPVLDPSTSTTESQPSRGSGGSQHSKASAKGDSAQPQAAAEKAELVTEGKLQAPKRAMSFQSAFPPEITPKSRAKSLSKHLSVSSLHKTSFKGSARRLEVIREAESKMLDPPSSEITVPNEMLSTDTIKRNNEVAKEGATLTKKSFGSEKKRSNNSAEGIHTFVLPPESLQDGKLPTKQPSQVGGVSMGDMFEQPLVDGTNQTRNTSKLEEVKQIDLEQEPNYHSEAKGDVTRAEEDGLEPGAVVAAEDPSSLQPLPQSPDDFLDHGVAPNKASGESETDKKLEDGTNTSPLPVQETAQANGEDDVRSEMKNLVDVGPGKNGGSGTEADKHVPDTVSPPRDSTVQSMGDVPRPRRQSSEDKRVRNRDDWHPVEDPPSIQRSDVDVTRDETPPVEPKASEPKKSYDTNDSEQIFERYQHPEAAIHPSGEEEAAVVRTGGAQNKEKRAEESETVKKVEKQDNKKKKGKSVKKGTTESESAEPDGDDAEAAVAVKAGSAASLQSKDDIEDDKTVEELKEESNTSV